MTDQQTKTEITPERADYIRSHMDLSIEELQSETGLTKYVIRTIKEAKRNNYYHIYDSGKTKWDRLTDEMKTYLKTVEFEYYKDMASKFNRTFALSDLTPIHKQTLTQYYRKLEAE